MKLSSAYLYEQLAEKYVILNSGGLSGRDGYLRPFLLQEPAAVPGKKMTGRESTAPAGHVWVVSAAQCEDEENRATSFRQSCSPQKAFYVYCIPVSESNPESGTVGQVLKKVNDAADEWGEATGDDTYIQIILSEGDSAADILNDIQLIFDRCDQWDRQVNEQLTQNGGIGKILELTADFLSNPLMVMGLDFSLVAETGMEQLPKRARLFTEEGVNMEYMNALLQNKAYQNLAQEKAAALFPAYIGGCRSLNVNLYAAGQPMRRHTLTKDQASSGHALTKDQTSSGHAFTKDQTTSGHGFTKDQASSGHVFAEVQPTHRLVLTECRTMLTPGHICVLEALAGRLEYLISHEEAPSMTGDLEQIFQRVLSDRTADYMQISRQLSALGWSGSHQYLCLILQITYLNQKQLSTKAICRYIRKQFDDSISFLYQDEIVTFFNLTRLELDEEQVASGLVYFIRDSYLKAGYSRTMQGHMNLRRQYVQARTALDVGSRKKPYIWIHHFSQVALTYIMEQATRRLPGNMLCHEGILRLREQDQKNHTEYMQTLKMYLAQHLNATQTAKELFIHRSTFLYRLDKIREILQSDLEDPEELFYLELSMRLLEQEEEKS